MSLIGIIILGTVAMTPIMLLCNKYYKIPWYFIIISACMLTITGMLGGSLMYFIENGKWGSQSFFGAILFAPPMMYIVAKILHISTSAVVDMCAPTGCIFLAVQKIQCLRADCCRGKVVGYNALGEAVRFPSQILECAAALLICIFLFWLIGDEKNHGKILPTFLVLYGISRFLLNLTRETTPFLFGLPAGNVWSLVAIIEGVLIFTYILLRKKKASE